MFVQSMIAKLVEGTVSILRFAAVVAVSNQGKEKGWPQKPLAQLFP